MQSNHLQSLIALNANRITAKHNSIENAIAQAKQFKLVKIAPAYRQHVEAMVATAFKIADKGRSELKKAVELQKALQAELRANRVAERAAAVKLSTFFTNPTGYGDGTFCVEVPAVGDFRICHMKDGTSRHIEGRWLGGAGLTKHATRQFPIDVQVAGIYNIARDGQPKQDGVYQVMYKDNTSPCTSFYFEDGAWRYRKGGIVEALFGNVIGDQHHEHYVVK